MDDPQAPAKPSWLRLSVADAIFVLAVIGILRTMPERNLDDPGLGWHVRNIDAMIEQGGWLERDPFCRPRGEVAEVWFTNQWLGDLVLWLGWHWAGLGGIAALAVLFLAFTYRHVCNALLADGLAWPLAAFWTFWTMMASYYGWVARPNMVNLLFLFIVARQCDRFHRGESTPKAMLWLLPLFAVWANTHGGFLGGLITLAAVVAIETALAVASFDPADRDAARQRTRFLALLAAGAFLATLLNPYGPRLYWFVLKLFFADLRLLDEWKPTDFASPGALRFELLILLFPVLLMVSRKKPSLVALGLMVMWLHFALTSVRNVPLWVVVAVPPLALASTAVPWLNEAYARLRISDDLRQFLALRTRGFWPVPVVVGLLLLGWARWGGLPARHSPKDIPTAALHRLLDLDDGNAVVFHDANWGGYLTWHGWDRQPRFRTWVDDRYDVQGPEHYAEYFAILGAGPGWQEKLRQHGIGLVCVPPDAPLAQRLAETKGWQETYRDPFAVIFQAQR